MKVVVAMSGGVDSSVAAALLKEADYQVTGVTMQLLPRDKPAGAADASRTAAKLGIPHRVIDFSDIFADKVIADFCREYRRGRTPNPCIRCNRHIKFGALLEKTIEMGADFIATGHHARIERDESGGRYLLKKGVDVNKDQSYFLGTLTQQQLSQILLPVGSFSKDRVRKMADRLGLPAAARPESQEICFVTDDDYPKFLKGYIPEAAEPGLILDKRGNILGSHPGILFYTIGQRKGLGIAAPEPRYVIDIRSEDNAIIVGDKEDVYGNELIASGLNWISIPGLSQPLAVTARIRYRHREAEATVTPLDEDEVQVKFKQPQMAITPGQAVVFYEGDTVIGGGTIATAGKSQPRDRLKIGGILP